MNSVQKIKKKSAELMNQKEPEKPTIVAYGLMNTGKSFLLNMLTENYDKEFFKTNDIRETSTVTQFETEKYYYIDTPGLDANDEDDYNANLGIKKADVVLFVHQPQGELEANEVSFIKELKKSFGSFSETSIIIVISKMEKEDEEKIGQIHNKIASQCKDIIGFSPKIFRTSNQRYKTGVSKNIGKMIASSNIDKLIVQIDESASRNKEIRSERKSNEAKKLLNEISLLEKKLQDDKDSLIKEMKVPFLDLIEKLKSLDELINQKKIQFDKI